jgi:hypothetical protein
MSDHAPTETVNLDIYGAGAVPWSRAEEALGHGSLPMEAAAFLSTVRPDGRPHSAGIGIVVHDGALFFTSGPGTRKSRNLAANPSCTVSMRLDGLDLVIEGEAQRVTDAPTLETVAALFRDGGWPAQVEGDALTAPYSAQSAGPPPWQLYRMPFRTAFGVATREPFGASRWRFGG